MTSPAQSRNPAILLAAAMLLLAAAPAQAERVMGKLQVSAEVVVSCQLDAKVPRVGTAERVGGGASFSVKCTRGALAGAAACEEPCAAPRTAETARSERVEQPQGDGTTVATVLF